LAKPQNAQKEGERVVREGETFEHKKVIFKIVELAPHFDPQFRPSLMIGYKLIDGDFTSETAHIFIRKNEDPRPHVERVVDHYLGTLKSILGVRS
jgi:hypothetical protein